MEVIGKVEVAHGATINLDAGKTPGWCFQLANLAYCIWYGKLRKL
jgi:hypothetical protein